MSAPKTTFEEMRREQKLCDAELIVGHVRFPVHKLLLCSHSSYFKALFTHWSEPDCNVFHIPQVSAEILQSILDFMYTGEVRVTPENVQDLLTAADRLDVSGVAQACCRALEEQLSPQSCVSLWWLTNTYHYPELRAKVRHYILRHFEEVLGGSEDFLGLSAEDLGAFIEEDGLNVRQEATVFQAVVRWIQHSPQQRERHFTELLLKVRLPQINPEYFQQHVLSSELVRNNHACKDLMLTTLRFMLDVRTVGSNASLFPIRQARPRLPRGVILAIGGWSRRSPVNSIEAFDNRANRWVGVANDDEGPRAYHGTVFLRGSLYLIGGYNGEDQICTTHRYDLAERTWREVANMHSKRCYVSVALSEGLIYAMGGYDGVQRLNTAERFAPDTNQWTMIAPMAETRSDASSAALGGKIYICGGFNGDECLSTAECYNPQTNQWSLIPEMSSRRSGLGVIAYNNNILAVAGFDGEFRLRSVEAFNPNTNTWRPLPSMLNRRSNFGVAVLDERLYVMGGFYNGSTISSVESWDVKTGAWTRVQDMHVSRSALSCPMVHDLPNMADYAAPHAAPPDDNNME